MALISDLIIQQAVDAGHERRLGIRKAWDAYQGQLKKPLKVKPGTMDDNVRINKARPTVEEGASLLFGEDTTFEVDKPDGSGADGGGEQSPEDKWLSDCWETNKRMTFLNSLALHGGVAGHSFVKVIPNGATSRTNEKFPRLILWDGLEVDTILDPEDFHRVLAFIRQWNIVDPKTGKAGVRRQRIEMVDPEASASRWVTTDWVSWQDNKVFTQIRTPEVWPFDWAPVFHCQNLPMPNEFYGLADLEDDIIEVNHGLNFLFSNLNRILRFHAHPKTIGEGLDAKKLAVAVDETICIPKDSKLYNLEMKSDLASSLSVYEKLDEAFHSMTRMPDFSKSGLQRIGAISGIALKILFRPALQKNAVKKMLYGDMLIDLNSKLLELGGRAKGMGVQIHWPNPLPIDDKEEAETAVLYDQLGVSRDTILTRLQFDADEEAEKRKKQDEEAAALALKAFDAGAGPMAGPGPAPARPTPKPAVVPND